MRRISRFVDSGLVVIILYFSGQQETAPARAEQKAVPGSLVLLASPGRVEGQGKQSRGGGADGIVKASCDGWAEGNRGNYPRGAKLVTTEGRIDRREGSGEARQSRIRLLRGHRDEDDRQLPRNTAALRQY